MGERAIVLDTETTGLDPYKGGHRIVEIGCIEIIDFIPTGQTFHRYINPEREVPSAAYAVHGLDYSFLSKFAPMGSILNDLLKFLENSPLVIHNAAFDMKFLNAEMALLGEKPLSNPVVDTLKLARLKYPGNPASLDMLCSRFKIDTTKRQKHGALLDAQLLAAVYVEMNGGREPGLKLDASPEKVDTIVPASATTLPVRRLPRVFQVSSVEKKAHQEAMSLLEAQAIKSLSRGVLFGKPRAKN